VIAAIKITVVWDLWGELNAIHRAVELGKRVRGPSDLALVELRAAASAMLRKLCQNGK
jgi:hypothetical protein